MSPSAVPTVRVIGPDGKDVPIVRPDMPVTIQVQLPPQSGALPDSVTVTLTTDKGSKTVSVPHQPGAGAGNPTYVLDSTQIGYGVADGYGVGKGPLAGVDIGNGGGCVLSCDGGAASFTWYPDDLQQGLGQIENFAHDMEQYLNSVLAGIKDMPDDPDVREVREICKQKLELIAYLKTLFANPDRWPRENLYAGQVIVDYLRTPGLVDLREVYPRVSSAGRQGREEGHDIVMRAFGELVIAGYAQFANATGAAQMWTLVFGQDIYGRDVGKWERFEAAADLALQAFMMGAPIYVMNQWNVARTTSRIARTRPRPPEGVKPTVAPEGTHVTAPEFGMQPGAARHANIVADANGVTIQVRPTSPDAMKWRELGHPGKPMDVKSKTINELDTHLGARAEDRGLVGYFEPKEPVRAAGMDDATWGRVQQRYRDRVQEFHDNATKMQHLIDEGKIRVENGVVIDTGICGGTGKAITGDYDLWKIARVDGAPLSAADRELIVNQLRFGEFGAQHGAHTDWVIDPEAPIYKADPGLLRGHQKVDADIRAKHLVGGEAVIEFGGRGRVPVTTYEGGAAPGRAWTPESVVRAPTPRTPVSNIPMRTLAAGAAALVFVAGVGWVAFGQGQQTQVASSSSGPTASAAPTQTPSTRPTATSGTAVAARAPRPQKMLAVFSQGTFSTRYSVVIDNPDGQPLTLKWAGPNCGAWDNQAEHVSPQGGTNLTDAMIWQHPHPPCAPTTDHTDVTVTFSIGYQGGTLICIYNGSESGSGPECKKL